jgi:conjugal transfer mating pair stabilization protein TraN
MKFGALVLGLGLLAVVQAPPAVAQTPIYIPPPVDPAEPVIMEPDFDPGLPAPGAPPPPLPAAPMTAAEARAEAKAAGSALRDAYRDLPLVPGAAGQIPHYQDGIPAEAAYYDNPDAMAGDGYVAGLSNEGYRTANAPGRPVVPVGPADIARAVAVEDDPQAYLDGENLTGGQGSCVPLPPGGAGVNYAEWTCNIGSAVVDQPRTCPRSLSVEEWNGTAYQYLCVTGAGFDYCGALAGNGLCRKTDSFPIPDYGLVIDYYDCSQTVADPNIYLYGTTTLPPPSNAFAVVDSVYRCNNDGLGDAFTADPLTGYIAGYESGLQACTALAGNSSCTKSSASAAGLVERSLCKTVEFVSDPYGLGIGDYLICTEFAQAEEVYQCSANVSGMVAERSTTRWFTENWIEPPCAVDPALCSLTGDVCTGGVNETRIVAGVAVTRPCWEYSKTYQCQTVVGGGNDCGALEADAACTLNLEICLDDPPNGACQVAERVYRCPIAGSTPPPQQYICGDDVYCINGDCEPIEREASTEFKDAVVALNALGQANTEFDENSLTLFRGTRETCHKKVFGLSNCCSGKGIPLLTPFLCSSAERQLDAKDDKGLCHKVGTYCSDRVLGVCVTRKDAYCCFQSKISRILQEQGRPQIGKPWRTPRTETCEGFTIYEFQQLDLSVMDFSEVYAEFQDAARLPDEAAALADIKAKIEAYYARH